MNWWHYLLLVNIYLVLFFGFYALLLRRETFFQLNRVYLVAASLLSFLIPLIQSGWVKNLFITKEVQYTIYNAAVINNPVTVYSFVPAKEVLTIGEILNTIYIIVTLFLVLRLIWQLVILKKAIEKPAPSAAYSFFKKISLGNKLIATDVIMEHEQVHASQWHSADVLIIEVVMIINWFNPVVYLYRFAIKYIHEFIADRQVIQSGRDKADYAMLLLNQTFNVPAHGLVTPFYTRSMLKKRIMMLQKSKSQRIALAKYGLSAPLFMLMLILSSATINNSKAVKIIDIKTANALSTSADDVITEIADHSGIPENAVNKPATIQQIGDNIESEPINMIKPVSDQMFTSVESQPRFPGSLGDFLRQNIKYPAAMREANVQGKVYVQFVVETDGSLSNIKVLRDVGYGSAEEAERVIGLSPKWQPANQNGKLVKVAYTVPINFTLVHGGGGVIPNAADTSKKKSAPAQITGNNGIVVFSKITSLDIIRGAMRARGLDDPIYMFDGTQKDKAAFDKLDVNTINSIIIATKGSHNNFDIDSSNGIIFVTAKSHSPDAALPQAPGKPAGKLLGNIRGLNVSSDGSLSQNGKAITKIRIDGKDVYPATNTAITK
jgi:TonB family protein